MINLLYVGNDGTFDGVLISLISCANHYDGVIKVYILTMDFSEQKSAYKPFSANHGKIIENYLQSVNPLSAVKIIDVRDKFDALLLGGKNEDSRYTPYAYLRLLCGECAEIPDKVIYMDYDAVFLESVELLWNVDVKGYDFAAVKDYYGRFFINPRYVNSGVMVMNVKKMRADGTFHRCISCVKNIKMLLPDQTALNKHAVKKKIIARRFNEQHAIRRDTVVRHFSMTIKFFPRFKTQNVKPWDIEKLHKVLKVYEVDDVLDIYLEIKDSLKTGL